MILIRCVAFNGLAQHHPSQGTPAGQYLRTYDPEYADGRGYAVWTDDPEEALRFETSGEAWMLWRKVPFKRPRRDDGAVNRPLTAFTVELVDEEDVWTK